MFVGGVVVGIAANPTQALRATDRSTVYTVYEANVTDPEGYKNNFLKVVAPKLEKHGIKYLVRGGAPKALMSMPPKVLTSRLSGHGAPLLRCGRITVLERKAPGRDRGLRVWC